MLVVLGWVDSCRWLRLIRLRPLVLLGLRDKCGMLGTGGPLRSYVYLDSARVGFVFLRLVVCSLQFEKWFHSRGLPLDLRVVNELPQVSKLQILTGVFLQGYFSFFAKNTGLLVGESVASGFTVLLDGERVFMV